MYSRNGSRKTDKEVDRKYYDLAYFKKEERLFSPEFGRGKDLRTQKYHQDFVSDYFHGKDNPANNSIP